MPNREGVITGGLGNRGFNDKSARGYPLELRLSTQQVSIAVTFDESILSTVRHVPPSQAPTDWMLMNLKSKLRRR